MRISLTAGISASKEHVEAPEAGRMRFRLTECFRDGYE